MFSSFFGSPKDKDAAAKPKTPLSSPKSPSAKPESIHKTIGKHLLTVLVNKVENELKGVFELSNPAEKMGLLNSACDELVKLMTDITRQICTIRDKSASPLHSKDMVSLLKIVDKFFSDEHKLTPLSKNSFLKPTQKPLLGLEQIIKSNIFLSSWSNWFMVVYPSHIQEMLDTIHSGVSVFRGLNDIPIEVHNTVLFDEDNPHSIKRLAFEALQKPNAKRSLVTEHFYRLFVPQNDRTSQRTQDLRVKQFLCCQPYVENYIKAARLIEIGAKTDANRDEMTRHYNEASLLGYAFVMDLYEQHGYHPGIDTRFSNEALDKMLTEIVSAIANIYSDQNIAGATQPGRVKQFIWSTDLDVARTHLAYILQDLFNVACLIVRMHLACLVNVVTDCSRSRMRLAFEYIARYAPADESAEATEDHEAILADEILPHITFCDRLGSLQIAISLSQSLFTELSDSAAEVSTAAVPGTGGAFAMMVHPKAKTVAPREKVDLNAVD